MRTIQGEQASIKGRLVWATRTVVKLLLALCLSLFPCQLHARGPRQSPTGAGEQAKQATQQSPNADLLPVADKLTDLVPDDVGLVVHVRDLRGQLRLLERSPFYRRIKSLETFHVWTNSQGFRRLSAAAAYVETLADRPFRELVEDLFGQSVVLGVWPRQGGEPNVVLATKAASEQRLKELLQVWQEVDKRRAVPLKYNGQTYVRWEKRLEEGKSARPFFYWLSGSALVLSNSDETLRRSIDLATGHGRRKEGLRPLSRSDWFSGVRSVPVSAAVVVGLNPRAWERDVAAEGNEGFIRLWRQCRSVIGWLDFLDGRGVRLQVAARWQTERSKELEPAVSAAELPKSPPANWPKNAFLVAYGKLQVRPEWVKAFEDLLSLRQRDDWQSGRRVLTGLLLGLDPFDQFLPACQGWWEVSVAPSGSNTPSTLPFDVVVRLPVKPEREVDLDSQRVTLRQAVDNALRTAGNLLAMAQNGRLDKPLTYWRSRRLGSTRLHWLENFSWGQPAYAWHKSSLWLATSRAALQAALTETGGTPEGQVTTERKRSALMTAAARIPGEADQVILVDLQRVEQWLDEQEPELVELFGRQNPPKRQSVQQRLRRLQDFCRAADFAYFCLDHSQHATTVTLSAELLPTN